MALTYPIWWIVTDSSLMLSQEAMKERMEAFGGPYYPPEQQSKIDQRRLNHDEFLATAGRAFGTFIADLENSGKFGNTTLIVSADQGKASKAVSISTRVFIRRGPLFTFPLSSARPSRRITG